MPGPVNDETGRPPLMRSPEFREQMTAGIRADHVAPINELVDDLREPDRGLWAPYIAPLHGGVDARMLFLLPAPGAGTDPEAGGSGFLCSENDDEASVRLTRNMEQVGITPEVCVGWNVYPWLIGSDREPTLQQVKEGLKPLLRLLPLLPRLEVVVLLGKKAEVSWDMAGKANPRLVDPVTVRRTHSTGKRAFLQKREEREKEQLEEFRRAAGVLGVRPAAAVTAPAGPEA